MSRRWFALPAAVGLAAAAFLLRGAEPAEANHSWSNYHWGRAGTPFTLTIVNNLGSSQWAQFMGSATADGTVAGDWSRSDMFDLAVVTGRTDPGTCGPTDGKIEVCNGGYGENGWLGVAQIWPVWSGKGFTHIGKANVKLNDSYSQDLATKQYVLCQEVGHAFGLDHQDENHYNTNLGTCMDYTAQPGGGSQGPNNLHPNQHDFDQLVTIYAVTRKHARETSTAINAGATTSAAPNPGNRPADWGTPVKVGPDGRPVLYRREFSPREVVYTWVIWANQRTPPKR